MELLERHLWAALAKSTKDKEVQSKKKIVSEGEGNDGNAPAERIEVSVKTESQSGSAALAGELRRCLLDQAKLLGANNPDKVDVVRTKRIEIIRIREAPPRQDDATTDGQHPSPNADPVLTPSEVGVVAASANAAAAIPKKPNGRFRIVPKPMPVNEVKKARPRQDEPAKLDVASPDELPPNVANQRDNVDSGTSQGNPDANSCREGKDETLSNQEAGAIVASNPVAPKKAPGKGLTIVAKPLSEKEMPAADEVAPNTVNQCQELPEHPTQHSSNGPQEEGKLNRHEKYWLSEGSNDPLNFRTP